MSSLPPFNPDVAALQGYHLDHPPVPVKLDQNENPFGLPADLVEEILARAREEDWARYPAFDQGELRRALADHLGVRPEMVRAGNGSNELLQAALLALLPAGSRLLYPVPTFSMYRLLARARGLEPVEVLQLQPDPEALRAAVTEVRPAAVLLCTPNNPTGAAWPREAVEGILAAFDGWLILDQAYVEFGGEDFLDLVTTARRVLVLRTFSKAMALAGLRCGYLVADPEVMAQVEKVVLPYNLNRFTALAARVVLERYDRLRPAIGQIVAERERLYRALQALPGVHPYPSQANFLLLRFDAGIDAGAVLAGLRERGVLIRDVGGAPGLAGHLRVSVGTPAENDRFLEGLEAVLRDLGGV